MGDRQTSGPRNASGSALSCSTPQIQVIQFWPIEFASLELVGVWHADRPGATFP